MFRRSLQNRSAATLNKGVQKPGPVLAGWGRTSQKRRLEYEYTETLYGCGKYHKELDEAGITLRCTDPNMVRTYWNYSSRMGTWFFNAGCAYTAAIWPAMFTLWIPHLLLLDYDARFKRAAWW